MICVNPRSPKAIRVISVLINPERNKNNKAMLKKIIPFSITALFISNILFGQTKPAALSGDLIIFHAGSLSVPMKEIAAEFMKLNPDVKVLLEPAGSVECARKITDLQRPCDIMASSDYKVIDKMLVPQYADWNIRFASNEMCIVYSEKSRYQDKINSSNWFEYLKKPGLATNLGTKDQNYIRPKEVDLLALLENNSVDYIFLYRSVAVQHELKYIILPDQLNLKNPSFADLYSTASVQINGKQPGLKEAMKGEPMVYGITLLKDAPNKTAAIAFLEFMLSKDKGMKIMVKDGQPSLIPQPVTDYNKVPGQLKKFVIKR
jgi:molybdate/tungstate transport system substrate-binding protein